MKTFEFRAAREGHGFAGFVQFDSAATIADAAARIIDLGFSDITYLALADGPEPGAPVWPTPIGTLTAKAI